MYKVRKTEDYYEVEAILNGMYAEGYELFEFIHKGSGIFVMVFKAIDKI